MLKVIDGECQYLEGADSNESDDGSGEWRGQHEPGTNPEPASQERGTDDYPASEAPVTDPGNDAGDTRYSAPSSRGMQKKKEECRCDVGQVLV